MRKFVEGYVMGKDRTVADGKYIMLEVYDARLVKKLHEFLIEDASFAMDNKQYDEAEALLRDANSLDRQMEEYDAPLESVDVNKVNL